MSLTINTEQRIINLTLSSQQGPAGASTVAAEAAALAAQASQLAAETARTQSLTFRNESQAFSVQSANFADDSFDSAAASASSATASAASAASALNTLGLVQTEKEFIRQNYYPAFSFDSYAVARDAVLAATVPFGSVIFIVNDERFSGARTFCRADQTTNTIDFNFTNGTYAYNEPVQFLAFAGVELVDVPMTSSAAGFKGAVAVNETHLFVHTGSVWKRIALEIF